MDTAEEEERQSKLWQTFVNESENHSHYHGLIKAAKEYTQSHTNEVLDTLEERVKIRKADAKDSIHSDTEKFKERVNSCSWFINQIQKLR